MAEDLAEFLKKRGMKAEYLHSDVKTIDRIDILTKFRRGSFDILVGVNLLREGLDLPEVELVGILDADKEGFLRSETSLIQTIGRAARNVLGKVVLYADTMTGSLERAISETNRRRELQLAYNKKHGITPTTIQKAISESRLGGAKTAEEAKPTLNVAKLDKKEVRYYLEELKDRMDLASKNLEFEKAAALRDEIVRINQSLKRKKHRI